MNELELLKLLHRAIEYFAKITAKKSGLEEEDIRQDLCLCIILNSRKYVSVSGVSIDSYYKTLLYFASLRIVDLHNRKVKQKMKYYPEFIYTEISKQVYETFEIDMIDKIISDNVLEELSKNNRMVFLLKSQGVTWTAIAKQFQVTSKTLRKNLYNEVSLQHKLFECVA